MSSRLKEVRKARRPQEKAGQTKTRTRVVALLSGAATLLGVIMAALALLPRVSVVPSDPVDPSNPFSASFTITNNNFIPLGEVSAWLGTGQVVTQPKKPSPGWIPNWQTRISKSEWKNHKLTMDERFTVTPADVVGLGPSASLEYADIAIIVVYRPWILPLHREKVFRFDTRRQTNGLLYWYSKPVD